MNLVANVWDYLHQYLIRLTKTVALIGLLLLTSCNPSETVSSSTDAVEPTSVPSSRQTQIKQVEPPKLIQQLGPWLDNYAPQIAIRQPRAEQVFEDTTVNINLNVKDLPIYKDDTWELGPHIELLLDNQPYGEIYDLEQPISLENLTPGTHTIRAFATRPWYESFKNEGAYDQVTFHIFAKTDENAPAVDQPLLTYGSPVGTYGAEPVLLDFYLTDAPLHEIAKENPAIDDWRIRYTINGDSLTLDNWESIYIEGLKPGRNWIQLNLVDLDGNPIPGVFNNTVRLIEYDPTLNNGLAKIVQGDARLEMVGTIVDPSYEPPVPEAIAPPEVDNTENTEDNSAPEPKTLDADEATLELETDDLNVDNALPNANDGEQEDIEATDSETHAIETAQPENDLNLDNSLDEASFIDIDQQPLEVDAADSGNVAAPQDLKTTSKESSLDQSPQTVGSPEFLKEPNMDMEEQIEEPAPEPDIEAVPSKPEVVPENSEEPTVEGSEIEPPEKIEPSSRRYLKKFYDYRERALNSEAPS